MQVTHTEYSPLVLCDNCPRAFHMACLGLEYAQLPEGDWECPKCADKKDAAVRRLLDFELRRHEADKCGTGLSSSGLHPCLTALLPVPECFACAFTQDTLMSIDRFTHLYISHGSGPPPPLSMLADRKAELWRCLS